MVEPRWGGRSGGRPFRHGGRRERRPERRELRPRPLGDKCNPLCPFFRCSRRALRIRTERFRGRPLRVAFCEWIGDTCIGASCKYAYCERGALLPDGRCAFAVQRSRKPAKEFEDELRELEEEEKRFKHLGDYL